MNIVLSLQTVHTLMKCRIMRHLIRVFTCSQTSVWWYPEQKIIYFYFFLFVGYSGGFGSTRVY